jgi:hypothetical protein
MGWYYTDGASRSDIIDELTKEQVTESTVFRTLRKCFRGNTMYALHESGPPEGPMTKWLSVYLLQRHKDSWGYKPLPETALPYYFDCPLSYLDEADPAANEDAKEWRRTVREAAEKRAAKKPAVGDTWTLEGCRIKEVEITSVRPLRGKANGTTYRIKRTLLGARVES